MATLAHQSNNPFDVALSTLIGGLRRLHVPSPIGTHPTAGDFDAIESFMLRAAERMDVFFTDIGFQVRDNAPGHLDMTQFDEVVSGAIIGNATYICEQAADMVRQDVLEMVS